MDAHDHGTIPDDPLQFQEAIDRFRARVPMTDEEFAALEDAEREFAFTVANVAQADLVAEVYEAIADAIENGTTLDDFKAEVGGALADAWGGDDPSRVSTIFRTNIACILPGQVFSGRPRVGSRARYSGEILQLRTKSGRQLALTPNHPVLSDRGFVAAKLLRHGDHIVSHGNDVDHLSNATQKAEQQSPAVVEDVFGSLGRAHHGRMRRTLGSLDLHGDARLFDGQIDIVGADCALLNHHHVARSQFGRKLVLERSAVAHQKLIRRGSRNPTFHRFRHRSRRSHAIHELLRALGPLLRGERSPFRRSYLGRTTPLDALSLQKVVELVHREAGRRRRLLDGLPRSIEMDRRLANLGGDVGVQAARFGSAAEMDSVKPKATSENGRTHSEFLREVRDRNPGQVARDQIVEIGNVSLGTHVYDFETTTGWYVIGGIIVSNCAYNEGRYDVMTAPSVKEARPYWRFDAIVDGRTDDECLDINGTVLHQDDGFWSDHYPPLHFNCRCVLAPLSEDEAGDEGIDDPPDDDHSDEGFGARPSGEGSDWEPDVASYPSAIGDELADKLADAG